MKVITGGQLRAARALLRWSADDLAEKSKIGVATIRRAEGNDGPPSITEANLDSLKRALEAAGVEFTNGGQPGVKMKARPRPKIDRDGLPKGHTEDPEDADQYWPVKKPRE
jgi:transcriptional regulator with XRE-family HTH domain